MYTFPIRRSGVVISQWDCPMWDRLEQVLAPHLWGKVISFGQCNHEYPCWLKLRVCIMPHTVHINTYQIICHAIMACDYLLHVHTCSYSFILSVSASAHAHESLIVYQICVDPDVQHPIIDIKGERAEAVLHAWIGYTCSMSVCRYAPSFRGACKCDRI